MQNMYWELIDSYGIKKGSELFTLWSNKENKAFEEAKAVIDWRNLFSHYVINYDGREDPFLVSTTDESDSEGFEKEEKFYKRTQETRKKVSVRAPWQATNKNEYSKRKNRKIYYYRQTHKSDPRYKDHNRQTIRKKESLYNFKEEKEIKNSLIKECGEKSAEKLFSIWLSHGKKEMEEAKSFYIKKQFLENLEGHFKINTEYVRWEDTGLHQALINIVDEEESNINPYFDVDTDTIKIIIEQKSKIDDISSVTFMFNYDSEIILEKIIKKNGESFIEELSRNNSNNIQFELIKEFGVKEGISLFKLYCTKGKEALEKEKFVFYWNLALKIWGKNGFQLRDNPRWKKLVPNYRKIMKTFS